MKYLSGCILLLCVSCNEKQAAASPAQIAALESKISDMESREIRMLEDIQAAKEAAEWTKLRLELALKERDRANAALEYLSVLLREKKIEWYFPPP